MKYSFTTTIAAPVADVFDVVTRPEMLPKWRPSIVEASWAAPDETPRVGAKGRILRNFLSMRMELVFEVVELEENSVFTIDVQSGPVPPKTRVEFTPGDGSTSLKCIVDFRPTRGFGLVAPVVASTARRDDIADFKRLKSLLENGEADG